MSVGAPQSSGTTLTVENIGGALEPYGKSSVAGILLIGLGRYQQRVLLLVGMAWITVGMTIFLPVYTEDQYVPVVCPVAISPLANESAPIVTDDGLMDNSKSHDAEAETQWCPPERGTIAYDFSLFGPREWKLGTVGSLFFAGCLVGASVGGALSDINGRRATAVHFAVLMTLGVFGCALAPNVEVYAACRFLVGVFNQPLGLALFTLGVEWCPPAWRTPLGVGYIMISYSVGEMSLVPFALVFREWRNLHAATGVACAVSAALLWGFLPESALWLRVQGERKNSQQVLLKAARFNARHEHYRSTDQDGIELLDAVDEPSELSLTCSNAEDEVKGEVEPLPAAAGSKQSASNARMAEALKVLLTPTTMTLTIMWFSVSVSFYGLSLGTSGMQGNLYTNAFLSGLAEVPAAVMAVLVLDSPSTGRRVAVSGQFLAGGGSLALSAVVASKSLTTAITTLGKLFIAGAFDSVYMYTSEIYPTTVRATGISICSAAARVGGVMVPPILNLTGPTATALIFAVCCLASGVLCAMILPETAGKPLSDGMDDAEERKSGDNEGEAELLGEDVVTVNTEADPTWSQEAIRRPLAEKDPLCQEHNGNAL